MRKDLTQIYGRELLSIYIESDGFMLDTTIARVFWLDRLGIVGGIYGFIASIAAVIVGYFANFDYHAHVIKNLFLER